MTTFTEGFSNLEFLICESPGDRSREAGVLLTGNDLASGAVLGKITKAIAAAPIPTIVGTGTGLMSALTFGPDVQTGSYVITLTATGATAAFSVTAPDGTVLPTGNVATAYTSTHLSFLIANGGTMTTGDVFTVVVTAGGTPVLVGTGTGVVSAFSLGPDAMNGAYRVQLLATSATGEFEVIAPDGSKLKRGQVATAYASNHVNFTLANGGTMTSGDYFNIVVAKGSGKYTAVVPTTYDGRHVASAILAYATDATDADQDATVFVRDCTVKSACLTWPAAVTTAQKVTATNALASQGVILR
jgi:hypothetical protein